MDLSFLAQADSTTLKLELAKKALDRAKTELENAKQAYDELFARAEEHGIAKAKLKKLTEERVLALIESGIVTASTGANAGADSKRERPVKKSKKSAAPVEEAFAHAETESDLAEETMDQVAIHAETETQIHGEMA